MRSLVSLGVAIALMIWSAGAAFAAPWPALLPQRAVPPSMRLPLSATPGVLHSFADGTDGAYPEAALIDVNGILYGTTCAGGKYQQGTVFAVTAAGTEHVIFSFGNRPDGACPRAGLVDVNGILYGTTVLGGKYGWGTVFAVTAAGTERVRYSFDLTNKADGGYPYAGLTNVGGVLYGTTAVGGKYGEGTVFAVTPSGTERVLYNFSASETDGHLPQAGLVDVNGVLYGTTFNGGKYGSGIVFAVTTTGAERVLYSFDSRNRADAGYPQAGLVDVNGILYGTTWLGGKYGGGTVFAVTASGTERVLHSFGNGTDGEEPSVGLIDVGGVLYGTTEKGGKYNAGSVFAITTAGSERVLRNFGFCRIPDAQLIDVKGVLYGTTSSGGTYNVGTLFFVLP